jgi:hypothetical protein
MVEPSTKQMFQNDLSWRPHAQVVALRDIAPAKNILWTGMDWENAWSKHVQGVRALPNLINTLALAATSSSQTLPLRQKEQETDPYYNILTRLLLGIRDERTGEKMEA